MRRHLARVLTLAMVGTALFALPTSAGADTTDVQITEIRIDQPGSDDDEFFELSGPAGQTLDGLTYVVIGDGSSSLGSGVVENVTDLSGSAIHADGTFIAAESTFSLGDVDLTTTLNFENSDNVTHLLVSGFSGSDGDDLDTDDDGTLDVTPWTAIVDGVALVERENPPSGSGNEYHYADIAGARVGPDGTFVPGHVYRDAAGDWQIGEFEGGDETVRPLPGDPCEDATELSIPEIQGTGSASPYEDSVVLTTGVVTEVNGDRIWFQDPSGDGDLATSDALEVDWEDLAGRPFLNDGDAITVCGTVEENRGLTQLIALRVTDEGPATPIEPLPLTLPAPRDLETYESMFVSMDQTLYAADIYNALRFGEAGFSGTPLWVPTELYAPGSPEAAALADENTRNLVKITLGRDLYDDLMDEAGRYLRWGDTIDLGYREGHLTETFNAKQFRIMGFPFFVQASDVTLVNDRPEGGPVVSGDADTVVASFNVFNYWTSDLFGEYDTCADTATDVEAECGPEPRGHRGDGQKANQRAAIVDAITAMGADVVALQELETPGLGDRNAGDDPNETLIDLVGELNAAEGAGTWDYVPVTDDFLDANTNAIMSGFIYKPARVESTGDMLYLGELADLYDRLPVAATFRRDGAKFTVVNNHWKSKGCSDATGLDTDQGDGQGCYNATRTSQAEAVVDWIEEDLVKQGRTKRVLVVGDLNSYSMEDPIGVLEDAGLVDLVDRYETPGEFSYVFFGQAGSLDHAFATKQMDAKVTSVDVWDINAAESNGLSYFGDEPSAARWRSSDHDPVVVGLDLLDD